MGDTDLFKGLGNLANLGSIMKQAQQVGSKLQIVTDKLKAKRITGTSGGGLIQVEANGEGEVLAVRIDRSLVERGEIEMIEDLLPSAVNQTRTKAKQLHGEAMKSMTEGLDLPGLDEALKNLIQGG